MLHLNGLKRHLKTQENASSVTDDLADESTKVRSSKRKAVILGCPVWTNWGGLVKETWGGHEAHAAENWEASSSGVRDHGQRLPFITAKLGNAEDSVGQPPTARCGLLPWQTSQGPKKTDDKYNNTRCNYEGQLPVLGWLLLSRPHSLQKSEKKKKGSVLSGKITQ